MEASLTSDISPATINEEVAEPTFAKLPSVLFGNHGRDIGFDGAENQGKVKLLLNKTQQTQLPNPAEVRKSPCGLLAREVDRTITRIDKTSNPIAALVFSKDEGVADPTRMM